MELAVKAFQVFEALMKVVIYGILKVFRIKLSEEQWNSFMQFVKFGFVGLSNTAVYYILYAIMVAFGWHIIVANTVAYLLSILNSFYWNHNYVFKENEKKRSILQAFLKCCLSYVGTFFLSTALLIVWVDFLHISKYAGPLLTIAITTPLNFIMNKRWAFKTE